MICKKCAALGFRRTKYRRLRGNWNEQPTKWIRYHTEKIMSGRGAPKQQSGGRGGGGRGGSSGKRESILELAKVC